MARFFILWLSIIPFIFANLSYSNETISMVHDKKKIQEKLESLTESYFLHQGLHLQYRSERENQKAIIDLYSTALNKELYLRTEFNFDGKKDTFHTTATLVDGEYILSSYTKGDHANLRMVFSKQLQDQIAYTFDTLETLFLENKQQKKQKRSSLSFTPMASFSFNQNSASWNITMSSTKRALWYHQVMPYPAYYTESNNDVTFFRDLKSGSYIKVDKVSGIMIEQVEIYQSETISLKLVNVKPWNKEISNIAPDPAHYNFEDIDLNSPLFRAMKNSLIMEIIRKHPVDKSLLKLVQTDYFTAREKFKKRLSLTMSNHQKMMMITPQEWANIESNSEDFWDRFEALLTHRQIQNFQESMITNRALTAQFMKRRMLAGKARRQLLNHWNSIISPSYDPDDDKAMTPKQAYLSCLGDALLEIHFDHAVRKILTRRLEALNNQPINPLDAALESE